MQGRIFNDTKKSYVIVVFIGLVIGFITEGVNLLPNDDFLSASSIAGTFGFWIFTTTFVIYFSCSNKNAMINTFIYLVCMNIGFYFLQAILDYFIRDIRVEKYVQWSHLFFWIGVSCICAVVAFVLYYWNRKSTIFSILYALPVAGMFLDTIGIVLKFFYARTHFLQLILNIVFLVIMLIVFTKNAKSKWLFLTAMIVVLTIGYFTVTPNFSQSTTMQTTLLCEIGDIEEVYFIKIRDDGKILEKSGNAEVLEDIKVDELNTLPEIVEAMREYYESQNGTCETVVSDGL